LARRCHRANAFYTRGFTIAAGTSEVQRNVLARQVLGL
jgi:alkylation response protein AidB-like acyl-CoA dehydrogenase